MRIDGITRSTGARRAAWREQPDTAPYHARLRFSPDGYVLDLTAEAIRHTGRGDMHVARYVLAPPDSYNAAGELAYYDAPERPLNRSMPVVPDPPPVVSFVAFEGMLRPV